MTLCDESGCVVDQRLRLMLDDLRRHIRANHDTLQGGLDRGCKCGAEQIGEAVATVGSAHHSDRSLDDGRVTHDVDRGCRQLEVGSCADTLHALANQRTSMRSGIGNEDHGHRRRGADRDRVSYPLMCVELVHLERHTPWGELLLEPCPVG